MKPRKQKAEARFQDKQEVSPGGFVWRSPALMLLWFKKWGEDAQ